MICIAINFNLNTAPRITLLIIICVLFLFYILILGANKMTAMDKTKEWELNMLMEKLRAKTGQFKTFYESAKALRMALLVSFQIDI